ncbi:hypothetical protein SDRG_06155 [Saprolegnia diclina VS20]|uniref:Uncharacterized protein n=1 Tax=Saprolegnia diclina (strain VS20) TaxID=1156394 RepID=T0QRW0_SAPDV|nr:hypothetical protein SDRG_06155 [Saprolegnia diclina VS20]EQC36720.1 hypothetical protein SDRG_06155 [Saprolegnia diclina VS20]|eukprot:XP_008610141.1 hypothetical protein SDRG_06155 [Saprolegnia diclina VS20]
MEDLVTYACSGRLPLPGGALMRHARWEDVGAMNMSPSKLSKLGQTLVRQLRAGDDDLTALLWVWTCTLIAKSFLCPTKTEFHAWYASVVVAAPTLDLPPTLCDLVDTTTLMRGLFLGITNVCPMTAKMKQASRAICTKYDVTLDVVLANWEKQAAIDRKLDVCMLVLDDASSRAQIDLFLKLLRRSRDDAQWSLLLLKLLEPRPAFALALLPEVATFLDTAKPSKATRKLVLDCMGIVAASYFRHELVCKALGMLLRDPDATLRLAALKLTVQLRSAHREAFVIDHDCDLLQVLVTAIVHDSAKSVVVASVHALSTLLHEGPASEVVVDLPAELAGHLISTFILVKAVPTAEVTHEHVTALLHASSLPIDLNTFMAAMAVADVDQKRRLVDIYAHRHGLSSLEPAAIATYLDTIVHEIEPFSLNLDSAEQVSVFLGHVAPSTEGAQLWIQELLRRFEDAIDQYNAPSSVGVIVLATSWVPHMHRRAVEQCNDGALQLLHQLFGSERPRTPHEEYAAAHALQFLLSARCKRDTWSSALEDLLANLLFCGPCQRSLIRLWYLQPQAQERVYYVVAHAQDLAFDGHDLTRVQSFVRLLGVVATENAQFIVRECPTLMEASPSSEPDEEHYMDEYELEMDQKRAIQTEREKTLNEGLLAAFLPLLEVLLVPAAGATFLPPQALVLCALASLGDFMRVSRVMAQKEYNPWLVKLISDSSKPEPLRSACLDIWASIQPTLHPSQVKSDGIDALYCQLEQLDGMAPKLLKVMCRLVLNGQLRSDKLRSLSFAFVAGDDAMEATATAFFRSFFRSKGKETCQRIYDVFFALDNVTARLAIIRKLLSIATSINAPLDGLHLLLIKECEEQVRLESASELLSLLAPTMLGTTKLLDTLERVLLLQPTRAAQLRFHTYLDASAALVARDPSLRAKVKRGLGLLSDPIGAKSIAAPPHLEALISQAWS